MALGVVGTLPSWLDLAFVRVVSGGLAILALVLVVVVVCTVRSIGTRLVVVAVLGAAVFGLMHYRQTLDRCDKNGCPCEFLGEELAGGGCAAPQD